MRLILTTNGTAKKLTLTCSKPNIVTLLPSEKKQIVVSVLRDGKDGLPGLNGKSLYQSWLDQGHVGSEADMLEWFKADPGNFQWGVIVGNLHDQADLMTEFDKKLNSILIGAANGIVPLDAGAKIATAYFPDEILGNVRFRGTYNGAIVSSASIAYNGMPLPVAASANSGIYFIVTSPFSRDGVQYENGDWILSLGNTGYSKVDNSDSVTSVFGRIGNIIANEADYQAFYVRLNQVYNNPAWLGSLSKSKVGLDQVDNTSDLNKPISTAAAAAFAKREQFFVIDTAEGDHCTAANPTPIWLAAYGNLLYKKKISGGTFTNGSYSELIFSTARGSLGYTNTVRIFLSSTENYTNATSFLLQQLNLGSGSYTASYVRKLLFRDNKLRIKSGATAYDDTGLSSTAPTIFNLNPDNDIWIIAVSAVANDTSSLRDDFVEHVILKGIR